MLVMPRLLTTLPVAASSALRSAIGGVWMLPGRTGASESENGDDVSNNDDPADEDTGPCWSWHEGKHCHGDCRCADNHENALGQHGISRFSGSSRHNARVQLRAVDSKARESALCCCTANGSNCDDFLKRRARQLQRVVIQPSPEMSPPRAPIHTPRCCSRGWRGKSAPDEWSVPARGTRPM
jgi:hypothetical protein